MVYPYLDGIALHRSAWHYNSHIQDNSGGFNRFLASRAPKVIDHDLNKTVRWGHVFSCSGSNMHYFAVVL